MITINMRKDRCSFCQERNSDNTTIQVEPSYGATFRVCDDCRSDLIQVLSFPDEYHTE